MTVTEILPTIREYRRANIDLENATLRMALFDTSINYDVDKVTDEFVADVLDGTTAQELDDATYGREPVEGAQVSVDATDEEVVLDADDVAFSGLDGGEEIQGALIYVQTGGDDSTPGDDRIVMVNDDITNSNGNHVTTNGGPVTIAVDSEGIATVAAV